jgi:pSer/pThr/pTyr-binding forkhead associated (FHA) protein
MPLTLVVRTDETGANPELSFDAARVVIGRGSGSDLWLPDPSVSHRHASIRQQGSDYALADEGSTNGTFVGEVRLERGATRQLRNGDLVRVGRVWIEVKIGASPVALDAAMATRDVAMHLVRSAMLKVGDDIIPNVHVVEGPDVGESVRLTEDARSYVVGRADTCDLALADADTSREHLSIVRRGLSVRLNDMGSKNGVFLGERPLPRERETVWKANLMVKLGRTVLALSEPVALALSELEALPDEVANVPAPPPSAKKVESDVPPSAAKSRVPDAPGGGDAPIAANANVVPAPRAQRKGANAADFTVLIFSILIIGVSIAALYWLLRGS